MQIRKLQKEEHGKTRRLWENVFSEDTKGFLDYYYFIKVQDNDIYVLEEDGDIRSMVQLNPYNLRIEDTKQLCHYVVGVSTEDAYRSRGYFGEVFRRTLADMYAAKEPFTYLMPAAKEIYLPYGFRYIYTQNRTRILCETIETEGSLRCCDAKLSDAEALEAFFIKWMDSRNSDTREQIYAIRDIKYWQTKIFELQSEGGGLHMVYLNQELVGVFSYYEEEETEVLEPLFLPDYENLFFHAISQISGGGKAFAKCMAYPFDLHAEQVKEVVEKPIIMARILHLETLLRLMKVKRGEVIDCSFAVVDPLIVPNNKVWHLSNEKESIKLLAEETEDSQGVITIESLTELLFGQKTVDELEGEEFVILPEALKEELKKIQPLERVMLNEVV